MKIAILGVGNILLRDEGIGVRVVEYIKEKYTFPDSIEIIDGGTMGLDLLPLIEGKNKVLIVDAVNVGKPPGTIVKIAGDDIPEFLSIKLSVHQIGLPDMLSAAKIMGIFPEDICLIGIQPRTVATGLDLSVDMRNRFNSFIEAVLDSLEKWGVKPKEKVSALPA